MKIKSDNNIRFTEALFVDFQHPDAPYTFRMRDHQHQNGKTYPSMYKIYMESTDEYEAAMTLLNGDYSHWEKLCALDWFMNGRQVNTTFLPGLHVWREHMRLRDESEAKKRLKMEANAGNVTAMKYLHEQATKKKTGRPEKKKPQDKSQGAAVERLREITGA